MRVLRPNEPNGFDRMANAMDVRHLDLVRDREAPAVPGASSPERRSRFVPACALEGRPIPPCEWLVPELVSHRTVTLFSGEGGTGTSLLALQLAVAAATDGREVTGGGVIRLPAEDDRDELHRRLADILAATDGAFRDLDALTVRSLAGEEAFLAVQAAVNVATTPSWA